MRATIFVAGRVLLPVAVAGLLACGGGGDGGTPPACVVQSVSVAPAAASLQVARTVTLTAGVTQQNCGALTPTWSTSAPTIASVTTAGLVTGLAPGTATISASAGGRSGEAVISVVAGAVFTVAISPATPSVEVRQTLQLTATARDTLGNVVTVPATWSTGDASVATVSATGLATGVRVGSVAITATASGRTGTATLTVTAPTVATIALTPGARTVDAGTTLLVQGQALDASGTPLSRTLTWSVSNAALARVVTTSGNTASIELLATGNVTVTGSADGKGGAVTLAVSARRPRFGYAYVFDTTGAPPAVAIDTTDYVFNSSGGQVIVQRKGMGEWRVLFTGLRLSIAAEPMLPVVRALGTQAGGCHITSRYTGPFNQTYGDVYGVDVECRATDGTPQVRPFMVAALGSNYTTIPWAFAEIEDSVAATATNVHVPGGGTAAGSRQANDVYRLQFTPLAAGYDVWHAMSLSQGLACASVTGVGAGSTRGADLDCVNALGVRTRSRTGLFVLLNGRDGVPRSDATISAAGAVAVSTGALAPAVGKPATGVYNVRVAPPGFASTRYPAVIVTAIRSAANPTVACRVATLTTPIPGTVQARVECRDTQGTARDNAFAVSAIY